MDAEEESPSPIPRPEDQHDIGDAMEQTPLPDIGLSSDDAGDHDEAYVERFCYDRGETEYLLENPNGWMSAGSLGVSEAVVEARWQRCEARPVKLIPIKCRGTLYSHVRKVFDKAGHDDETLYEIELWPRWTPDSQINDKRVVPSLELNMDTSLRRSTRLMKTVDERKMRNEQIAQIVQLDLWTQNALKGADSAV
ncbi:hypothetical protein Z517_05307 [Fonsecaea pedrosoi CBS 271.37]|uniref:Unplaced genomic scaffold supercont1.3, whole genome shotgun sequence n=1 Tax=Fonsecaea pedrosoi CBS 271.37 TaxID=1442368 RepID=A0A0D2GUJ1_9EURO|nr:uncharacterized protein Z517_05307 [Fonsecaea pedrosoi CBS 271.37]KIW82280.1 hypothetical protein Z517_05307 [Fonsecaea pedrosoi CBS 271.37]